MSDKEFVDGLIVKKPHDNAPDFVKCSISIKRKELGNWLRKKDDEWINLQVKESGQSGKWYAEVDNWKPEKQGKPTAASNDFDDDLDSIPF
jgi:lipopolysaccharide export LptBFGC system permease protein LptF